MGLVVAWVLGLDPGALGAWDASIDGRLAPMLLMGAGVMGWFDDWLGRGLSPRAQLLGQACLCLPLAQIWGLEFVLVGLVVFAVINTLDHADGWCAGLCGAAALPVAPLLACTSLGFLPANVDRARRGERGPTAFLGDGGSSLLAIWVLLSPETWPALIVPAVDLARVCVERMAAGVAPWQGDRRHLGQRLGGLRWSLPAQLATLGSLALLAHVGSTLVAVHVGASTVEVTWGTLAAGGVTLLLGTWASRTGASGS